MIKNVIADSTRGFDVMCKDKVLASYPTLAEAKTAALAHKSLYVRYWAA